MLVFVALAQDQCCGMIHRRMWIVKYYSDLFGNTEVMAIHGIAMQQLLAILRSR